ncbi:mitochondrial ribosomal protein S18 precursor, putative [Plasmodium malariae]|uniref:Mitochondrial ribosomal protein S18, putative n=2 Tax=Plasmodium (Plasmodium) TaxID=418103 RepID=A0A1A8WC42_PLAMA|nr:mitochondrial ribosomal protein S18 precursor, putative [Plasmodium malariae]SBS89301.1 mitochondrial ribosomal protein S18 precursor, putative [Plasmodium malariae]SCP02568.1 mitochondrial ribosomal protein S18 precursor, putative [Plasmodium malariae]
MLMKHPKLQSILLPKLGMNKACKFITKGLRGGSRINKNSDNNVVDIRKRKINEKLEEVKVSNETSCNALFDECFEELYRMKKEVDKDSVEYDNSPVIEELNREEIRITKNIFERINKKKKHVSNLSYKDIYIDPYWNPFKEVNDLRREITYEFNEYSKLASIVEIKKQRRAIKKSLKEQYKLHNIYSDEYIKYFNIHKEENITCNDKNEKYWNPSFSKRKLLNIKSPFIWRHTHLLHNFISENGLILPRKINMTTRKQQIQIFKSICIARRMALYPYDRKPDKDDLIPLIDPMQLLVDELLHRYMQFNDLRAQAILKVMINKYPSLNYYKYFSYESKKNADRSNQTVAHAPDSASDTSPTNDVSDFTIDSDKTFSKMLLRYKKNYYENSFSY